LDAASYFLGEFDGRTMISTESAQLAKQYRRFYELPDPPRFRRDEMPMAFEVTSLVEVLGHLSRGARLLSRDEPVVLKKRER
jgi:hypothetical protein